MKATSIHVYLEFETRYLRSLSAHHNNDVTFSHSSWNVTEIDILYLFSYGLVDTTLYYESWIKKTKNKNLIYVTNLTGKNIEIVVYYTKLNHSAFFIIFKGKNNIN